MPTFIWPADASVCTAARALTEAKPTKQVQQVELLLQPELISFPGVMFSMEAALKTKLDNERGI